MNMIWNVAGRVRRSGEAETEDMALALEGLNYIIMIIIIISSSSSSSIIII